MTTTYPDRPAPSFEMWLFWIRFERESTALYVKQVELLADIRKFLYPMPPKEDE